MGFDVIDGELWDTETGEYAGPASGLVTGMVAVVLIHSPLVWMMRLSTVIAITLPSVTVVSVVPCVNIKPFNVRIGRRASKMESKVTYLERKAGLLPSLLMPCIRLCALMSAGAIAPIVSLLVILYLPQLVR